jgi:RNA polymerase sigma factor (sigma-70 family)
MLYFVKTEGKEAGICGRYGWDGVGEGSEEARLEMVQLYLPRFLRFVRTRYAHHFRHHEEDFEQEIRCALWFATEKWNPERSSFGRFANFYCSHAIRRYIPKMLFAVTRPSESYWKSGAEEYYGDSFSEAHDFRENKEPNPEKHAIMRDMLHRIGQQLTETQLATAMDVLLLERSYVEIAARCGVTPQAIENRLCTARRNMVKALANVEEECRQRDEEGKVAIVRIRNQRKNQSLPVPELSF